MRIGIATDSACDLPRSFLDKHHIVILPVSIKGPGGEFVDNRLPEETQDFYKSVAENGDAEFATRPFSPDEIRDLFLSRLVLEFDYVFILGLSGETTPHGAEDQDDQLWVLRRLLAVAVARARKHVMIGYKTGEQSELVRFFAAGTYEQVDL